MQENLAKDEVALKAIMIAGMIRARKDRMPGKKWTVCLPKMLHLELWAHLFVNCGMDAREADEWISQRLTRYWRQLKWQIPLALLLVPVFACLTGALSWLDAPMYLTIPLGLGQIVAWFAAFPLRCLSFCWYLEEHESKMDWCLFLEKCRGAFPLRIPVWVMALILARVGLCILPVCLIGLVIKLLFGL